MRWLCRFAGGGGLTGLPHRHCSHLLDTDASGARANRSAWIEISVCSADYAPLPAMCITRMLDTGGHISAACGRGSDQGAHSAAQPSLAGQNHAGPRWSKRDGELRAGRWPSYRPPGTELDNDAMFGARNCGLVCDM